MSNIPLQTNQQRFSLIDTATKEYSCSEGIYFGVKGMVVPFSCDRVVVLYNDHEIYLGQLGAELKIVPTKFK